MARYTTSNGSAFITTEGTLASGDAVVRAVPENWNGSSALPFVLYCHGAGGAYNQFTTLAAWEGLRTWLVDNGFGWVECSGNNDNWGNIAGRTAYEQAYQWAAGALPLANGKLIVIGRSMGGLVSSWLYTQSTIVAPQAAGWVCSSGVVNLEHRYSVHSGESSKSAMRSKFGATSDADFITKSTPSDPMKFDLSVWSGKKILNLIGTADDNVEPPFNGTMLKDRVQGTVALNGYDVKVGGDHGTVNGTYFQVPAMTSFISNVTGIGAATSAGPTTAFIASKLYIADKYKNLYELTIPTALS